MLQLQSPAKVNLFLRVVGKRADGYHELSSLFQTINLMDGLTFSLSNEDHLTCTDPSIPIDQSNLVMKALNLFRQKTGCDLKLNIHLDKRIPSEAGLGGGSSNAATTLWACNQLSGLNIDIQQLQAWSCEIGSDIPFFFSEGTAYCTGRGEQVRNLPPFDSPVIHIVKPPIGLSTPAVYREFKRNGMLDPSDLESHIKGTPHYFNDLEQPAFEIQPALKALKEKLLSQGFDTVLMSGSGSAFFCLGKGRLLTDASLKVFQACYINRSVESWY